jgi:diadenosine tetraphosphate (Ap4A) HIT family hydrolase
MKSMIHERVKAARAGTNPTVVTRVPSGWVVMADIQYVPGYCILLPDPVVPDLNSLDEEQRLQFLKDMVIIGDALLEVTEAYRINYEIQGNTVPILHAHVIPRYMSEPDELRTMPVWFYETKNISLQRFDLERDKPLMQKIENAVNRRL